MTRQKMKLVKAIRCIEAYQPIKATRAVTCTKCGSTNIQFRSTTRIRKCMKCGEEMPVPRRNT